MAEKSLQTERDPCAEKTAAQNLPQDPLSDLVPQGELLPLQAARPEQDHCPVPRRGRAEQQKAPAPSAARHDPEPVPVRLVLQRVLSLRLRGEGRRLSRRLHHRGRAHELLPAHERPEEHEPARKQVPDIPEVPRFLRPRRAAHQKRRAAHARRARGTARFYAGAPGLHRQAHLRRLWQGRTYGVHPQLSLSRGRARRLQRARCHPRADHRAGRGALPHPSAVGQHAAHSDGRPGRR